MKRVSEKEKRKNNNKNTKVLKKLFVNNYLLEQKPSSAAPRIDFGVD